MNFFLNVLCLFLFTITIVHNHFRGYYRINSIYAAPHYRSNLNIAKVYKWTTKGNYKPYYGIQVPRAYNNYYNYTLIQNN